MIAHQKRLEQQAIAKAQSEQAEAMRLAGLRGEAQQILGATDPRWIMGSLAPTPENAKTIDYLAENPEDFKRTQYERGIQKLALGGDEKSAASMLALLRELNPTYGVSPNIGVENVKPYAYVTSKSGQVQAAVRNTARQEFVAQTRRP